MIGDRNFGLATCDFLGYLLASFGDFFNNWLLLKICFIKENYVELLEKCLILQRCVQERI